MLHRRSPSQSPARKRQRLSSPPYLTDDDLHFTEDDLAVLDQIEAQHSQSTDALAVDKGKAPMHRTGSTKRIDWGTAQQASSSSPPAGHTAKFTLAPLSDDKENPFSDGFQTAAKLPTFASAAFVRPSVAAQSTSYDDRRSPSPDAPPEQDWDAFMNSTISDVPQLAGFSTGFALAGFSKANGSKLMIPSKDALSKAAARIDSWNKEDDVPPNPGKENAPDAAQLPPAAGFQAASSMRQIRSPKRAALSTLRNESVSPVKPATPIMEHKQAPTRNLESRIDEHRPAAFRSPLQKVPLASTSAIAVNSPLNPNRPASSHGFTTASGNASLSTTFTAPRPTSASGFTKGTPLRTPASALQTRTPRFVTPFKKNMQPGQPGRQALPQAKAVAKTPVPPVSLHRSVAQPSTSKAPSTTTPQPRPIFFFLEPPPNRCILAKSGLRPQRFHEDDMEFSGVDVATLSAITPETALYYAFHTSASTPPPGGTTKSANLGAAAMLEHLLKRGCNLATKPWVDNHWCLILWKLAGMVRLDPQKESDPDQRRWCWAEVTRQFLYRYERELNTGIRPPLRKIANQDVSPAFPMVLCISNVFWSPAGVTDDGLPIEPHPALEVTDGWYRLRAQVDVSMAKAVRRGTIRVGRKIGIAGARLSTERKDPMEILEAYNSTKLVISGNSSHLMPWHAKLGFMTGPCISTLNSLSPEGGVVAAMDFVITRLYPVAFLEFVEDENGQKHQEGPRKEAEELNVHERWKTKREVAASKIRENLDKKNQVYDQYMHRLQRKAGSHYPPSVDGYPPSQIEELYDQLEYPDAASRVIARASPPEAAWLAVHISKQIANSREMMGDEVEKELQHVCPPRDVRSFQVLIIQDAQTKRRPANRTAQLTVWGANSLNMDEGSGGSSFAAGQRYMATNLIPTHLSAWMDRQPGSEVYLSTRRDTRWTRIKTIVS